jgi:hypothetical protein
MILSQKNYRHKYRPVFMVSIIIGHKYENGCLFDTQLMHKEIFDRNKIPFD